MATIGEVGTFNREVGVKVDMEDAVSLLTPHDAPFSQLLPWGTTNVTKVEWMDEELLGQSFTVTTVTGTASPWTLDGAANSADNIRVGDILAPKATAHSGIQYVVTSVTDGNTIVVQSHGATTDSDDPTAQEYIIVGQYLNEGDDPKDARSLEREQAYNITQILQEAVEATRTARHRGQRGGLYSQGDPYDHEVMKKFKELNIRIERQLLYGQRVESSDKKKRSMGGIYYFLSTNTTSGVKANITTLMGEAIRDSYDAGGNADSLVLMVSPAIKSIIDTVDATARRTTRETTTAGYVIERYITSFGTVRIVVNRHLPATQGLVLDLEYLEGVNFDGLFHELLAKTGDRDHGEIVCEKSLKVRAEKAHGTFAITDA